MIQISAEMWIWLMRGPWRPHSTLLWGQLMPLWWLWPVACQHWLVLYSLKGQERHEVVAQYGNIQSRLTDLIQSLFGYRWHRTLVPSSLTNVVVEAYESGYDNFCHSRCHLTVAACRISTGVVCLSTIKTGKWRWPCPDVRCTAVRLLIFSKELKNKC